MIVSTVPEKHFYTIGDVCRLTGTKAHILRYWESQFKLLKPARRYSGHRKYTQREIDLINKIRYLIIERKFTLAGAKREIHRQYSAKTSESAPVTAASTYATLQELKRDVDACLELLGSDPIAEEPAAPPPPLVPKRKQQPVSVAQAELF